MLIKKSRGIRGLSLSLTLGFLMAPISSTPIIGASSAEASVTLAIALVSAGVGGLASGTLMYVFRNGINSKAKKLNEYLGEKTIKNSERAKKIKKTSEELEEEYLDSTNKKMKILEENKNILEELCFTYHDKRIKPIVNATKECINHYKEGHGIDFIGSRISSKKQSEPTKPDEKEKEKEDL
ncbi:MAG: hypothetical protein LBI70_02265 [Rickettsiales bacterium]|jgi:ribosomal protein S17E|nr:hypothetical protein [Rickettsiales bacterium]